MSRNIESYFSWKNNFVILYLYFLKGVVLLYTFFMLMKNSIICGKVSEGWQT